MNILKIGGKVLETTVCFSTSNTRNVGCYFSTCYYVERAEGFKHNNVHNLAVWSKDLKQVWWSKGV